MKEPNFFIIGAPKCGTTSLAHWLSKHPNIYMSSVKEPHYFSTDFSLTTWRDREDYQSLFTSVGSNHTKVGEASVYYLLSRKAVPRIEAELETPRYIVMLRNPVEMAPSLHWQAIFSGDEDVENFEKAWYLQSARESGANIPSECRDAKIVQYRIACRLGNQLDRLYRIVECDRVLTVFLEDVQEDANREWARILTFLDVPYWKELEFRPENRSKHWRWHWVRDLKGFYGDTLRRFGLPPLGWGVFDRLTRVSVHQAERKSLSARMRRELVETFSEDIDRLAELTGRDLSHWKNIA